MGTPQQQAPTFYVNIKNKKKIYPCNPQSYFMSRIMKNPAFRTCENKAADQLWGNRTADQRLCFSRHTGCPKKTITLLIGIYFYITTSTCMYLTWTKQKISIHHESAVETSPTAMLLPWLPWKQICCFLPNLG